MFLSISSFRSVICLVYLGALIFSAYIFMIVIPSQWLFPLSLWDNDLFFLFCHFEHKVSFLCSCSLLLSTVRNIFFIPSLWAMYILRAEIVLHFIKNVIKFCIPTNKYWLQNTYFISCVPSFPKLQINLYDRKYITQMITLF